MNLYQLTALTSCFQNKQKCDKRRGHTTPITRPVHVIVLCTHRYFVLNNCLTKNIISYHIKIRVANHQHGNYKSENVP